MLLLGFDALLLSFISIGCGLFALALLNKLFKTDIYTNLLGVVLAGLIFSNVYFNLISFWLPVNYISLLPLFILSTIVLVKKNAAVKSLITNIKAKLHFIFLRRNLIITIPVLVLLLYHWLLPPVNADSPEYHYATIRWFESYKVVPGLANVDGRLAYDSAAFIIQAAYAFSGLLGQPIYPLNGVLACLFVLWILTRILRSINMLDALVWFCLLYFINRALLVNMSSPTSDTLVAICLAYAFIQLFQSLYNNKASTSTIILPFLLILYSLIAKISAYPALLALPLVLWVVRKNNKTVLFFLKMCIPALLIFVPWFCRNVILSGYLFYPVPFIDVFHVDWKAPKDLLMLDYVFIKHLPITFADADVPLKQPPFPYWFMPWVQRQISMGLVTNLFVFFLAAASPLYWLLAWVKKVKIDWAVFCLWLVIYACVFIWLINVPEYRFGIVFLMFATVIPLQYVIGKGFVKKYKALPVVIAALFIIISAWYIYQSPGRKNIYALSFSRFLVYPLKDKNYYFRNNMADFKYTILNTGVKLYHQDSTHECMNACLPCMTWKYGTIEMRGKDLSDGFRTVQDDVSKNYPFVK